MILHALNASWAVSASCAPTGGRFHPPDPGGVVCPPPGGLHGAIVASQRGRALTAVLDRFLLTDSQRASAITAVRSATKQTINRTADSRRRLRTATAEVCGISKFRSLLVCNSVKGPRAGANGVGKVLRGKICYRSAEPLPSTRPKNRDRKSWLK